jgi:hypothetical protein
MCVVFFSLNVALPSIRLSISTQKACTLESSCLQCVVCRSPRTVVVLPLLGHVGWHAVRCDPAMRRNQPFCPRHPHVRAWTQSPCSPPRTHTDNSLFFTVRTQKSVGLVGGTPTYHPIEAFQPPDSAARTYQYSLDGRLFALAVPSGCVERFAIPYR